MANNKTPKQTLHFGGLTKGLLGYLKQTADSQPWIEWPDTGAWPEVKIPELQEMGALLAKERDRALREIDHLYNKRRDEMKEILKQRRRRLESYAERQRNGVKAEAGKFIMAGRITDRRTGWGLPNTGVNAFNNRSKQVEVATHTDELGYFRMEFSAEGIHSLEEKKATVAIQVLSESGEPIRKLVKSLLPKSGETDFVTAAIDGDKKAPASKALAEKTNGAITHHRSELERRIRILEHPFARLVEEDNVRTDTQKPSSKLKSDPSTEPEPVKKQGKSKNA